MSLDLTVNGLPFVTWLIPTELKSIDELQKGVVDALEAEAERLPVDRRQQFLAGVRQHAGDILKFLDYMEKKGASTIKIKETAKNLFSELKTIGEQLAHSNSVNRQQFTQEMSAYEPFKNFQLTLKELVPVKEHSVPSFTEIMARAQHANAEMNVHQNIALAKMTAGLIRAGGEGAVEAMKFQLCYSSPLNSLMCQVAGPPVKKALADVAEKFHSLLPDNRALSQELNSQFGIPLEEGKQYGEDALVVGMAMLPVPPLAKLAGRILPQAAKSLVSTNSTLPRLLRTAERFLVEDAGSVKLKLESDYWIKKFLSIDYEIVKGGGKGSHTKVVKENRAMVTIPQGQLPKGTAKSINRSYDTAVKLDAEELIRVKVEIPKQIGPVQTYQKPLPHRMNLSAGYLETEQAFVVPKEFVGVLQKDLYIVRYHNSTHIDKPYKHKNWMPLAESDKHMTIRSQLESLANPVSPEEITHVTLAKVPAGELVRFMHGKTKPRIDLMTNEGQKGGAVQYRFFDFDPAWIKQTREFPK